MAIFINDLFDFFWLYTVPGNMLNVVVIPLRLQLPELHGLKLAQGNAGFEALTRKAEKRLSASFASGAVRLSQAAG